MNKILISYFSASGVTKSVASKISATLNGDLFEIVPQEKYSDEDLDWHNSNSRSSVEMNNDAIRPKILNKIDNIFDYDTVLIGFPIWWDLPPRIINTFIEENNLTNKKVYVFATSGGSTISNSFNYLKHTYPNINFINGKLLSIYNVDENIKELLSK